MTEQVGTAAVPEAPTPLRNDYPKGAINEAIEAPELSYSYLREQPILEEKISDALRRLYRARELSEGPA